MSSKFNEKQLCNSRKTSPPNWLNQDFINDLNTSDGESVSVINPGEYNTDSGGPDFKHARIKIGRLTFVGDVEIDCDYSDWKNHGHNINKNYNKIIFIFPIQISKNNIMFILAMAERLIPLPIS